MRGDVTRRTVLVDAHRGASTSHPENTLTAFRAALEAGADSVEFDVQLSADLVPVVIHDETVDRTTDGVGEVSRLGLAELQRLDAGVWKGAAFAGERIPTLDETLEVLAQAPRINMELKAEDPLLAELAVAAVERRRLHHRVMVSSFHTRHLVAAKQLLPGVWTHLFLEEPLPDGFWTADGRFVNSLGVPWEHVTVDLAATVHAAGRALWAFTVDDPGEALRLAAAGVQAITTNDPVAIRRALLNEGF